MSNKVVNIKLRAFKIENPSLTESSSGILPMLKDMLPIDSTASQRCMKLNTNDADIDLLSNFVWNLNDTFLFGMMLRVIPAENGGVLSEDLFNRHIIRISDVGSGDSSHSQLKSHFYIALNNEHLVTNLPGNIGIERVQTYLNWLLESVRVDKYFELTEMTKLPRGVSLSQINQIEFGGVSNNIATNTTPVDKEEFTFKAQLKTLTDEILSHIIRDSDSLAQIRKNNLVEAKLFLRVKKKPKDLGQEEFQRVMGAVATNITNDSGIAIKTKDGNRYTGEDIKVKREVVIEKTTGNRIVEEQLKQKMEIFLGDLRIGKYD